MNQKNLFIFPKPTGNYTVGTKAIALSSHLPTSGDSRELMLQLWYPTDQKESKLNKYAPEYLLNSLKEVFKSFPEITEKDLTEIDSIRVHATPDAPISHQENSFPLILTSHGYYSSRFYFTAYCEELASNGYIVAAVDHTNDCGITQFPDGRIEHWKSLTQADQESDEFFDHFKTRIDIRVADLRFVLDQLTELNASDRFFENRIDLNKIGLMGHSLGGEAILHATLADDRIGAVAAMDGFPTGNPLPESFPKPFLALFAEKNHWKDLKCSEKKKGELAKQENAYKKLCTYNVLLKKSQHVIFTDFALFNHLELFNKVPASAQWIRKGEIDGFKANKIIREYLLAFFDKHLKEKQNTLLESQNQTDRNQTIIE